ncbi:helix-turn-helix domain-containing protein [Priestia taiwanensis]|uniref:Helix-turn-helix domain-containing protein n=1 Tax=Priestia taiwanensis TaxID=1347902 RepID=A0A917AKI3_9BACI|nr:helix-turn-helix domain-containing protein [Priestia taiwanensis]MBM7361962.1 hypothetical protein [Priestia taiwanensis]GGE58381.1 hypothetical protein GCM10007140_05910 [Priestia taiwanensis]
MITANFDIEPLRQIIREEMERANFHRDKQNELPPMLTITQLMELLHIKRTKASELLSRADFPVFREAGVLIPTHLLFQWIEKHTSWMEENTDYYEKHII